MKIDSTKHIIKAAVYVPYLVDTQGDWSTPEEIEAASYKFMKEQRTPNVDTHHDFQKVDAYVCESYIAKNDPDFPVDGTWIVAIKIEDPEIWKSVEEGEIAGISMAGTAIRIDNVDPPSEQAA